MFANVALVFSGQFVRYVSTLHSTLPAGRDALMAPDCTLWHLMAPDGA
jgi:hypothetical protein